MEGMLAHATDPAPGPVGPPCPLSFAGKRKVWAYTPGITNKGCICAFLIRRSKMLGAISRRLAARTAATVSGAETTFAGFQVRNPLRP